MQEWKYETHRFIKTQTRWTQASKIHCTSTADLIKTVIHCTSTEHDEPRTRSNPEHDSLHKPSKPILRVLHRSNPEHDEGSQTHQNRRSKQRNQSHMNQTPCEKKSIVIKWIKPSTGATDQMDLPTADQLMIHLLETQQTHQLRRSKQWNQNHKPMWKKKKIKPIKQSNPANGIDQPIHQANANQTH